MNLPVLIKEYLLARKRYHDVFFTEEARRILKNRLRISPRLQPFSNEHEIDSLPGERARYYASHLDFYHPRRWIKFLMLARGSPWALFRECSRLIGAIWSYFSDMFKR